MPQQLLGCLFLSFFQFFSSFLCFLWLKAFHQLILVKKRKEKSLNKTIWHHKSQTVTDLNLQADGSQNKLFMGCCFFSFCRNYSIFKSMSREPFYFILFYFFKMTTRVPVGVVGVEKLVDVNPLARSVSCTAILTDNKLSW